MIMQTQQTKTIRCSEQGFASMVIALILILVLALMTVGFAQIARREQQSSLAKQLATQANYAAESGINDAITDIKSGKIHALPSDNTHGGRDCITPADVGPTALTGNQNVEPTFGVSYSCLLVNLQPPSLVKQPLSVDKAWTTAFSTSAPLTSLTVAWRSSSSAAKPRTPLPFNGYGFRPTASWGAHPAVLQFSITPLAPLLGTDRNSMINNTFTAYLYPSAGANTVNYTTSTLPGNAHVIAGGCNLAATNCSVRIGLLPGGTGPYLVHIFDYYDSSNVVITGSSLLGPVNFIDGQAQIDVTGKAKNVLKRLQARVSLNGLNTTLPDNAIEAKNLCKRFSTIPAPDTTTYDTLDPSCALGPP